MLKEYLKQHNISIYSLAKDCDVAYSTLNDLANGKVDVMNCRLGMVKKLSDALGLSIDEFCDISSPDFDPKEKNSDIDYRIRVRNKRFVADFKYDNKEYNVDLGPVNEDSKQYVDTFAKWTLSDVKADKEWGKMYEILSDEKK